MAPRLGGIKQKNVLIITEPQDDFFCFIPPSLVAMYEFEYIGIGLLSRASDPLSFVLQRERISSYLLVLVEAFLICLP